MGSGIKKDEKTMIIHRYFQTRYQNTHTQTQRTGWKTYKNTSGGNWSNKSKISGF